MRLFRVFLAHELITQWRSVRFRGLASVYVVAASATSVALFVMTGRTPRVFGPATYNGFLLSEQPLLTALFAVGLAVDAIGRERDEGSFAVLSVAPISSAGYVLRRWLAVVTICAGVSLLPTTITAALAAHTRQTLSLLPIFFEGWLVWVLPSLLVSSALAMALGTITGRTVLAIIFGALLITAGIGIMDDLLFYARITFAGPSDLFTGGDRAIQELVWTLRGFWFPRVPSDAAFPLRSEARALLSRAGITTAITIVLLSLSIFYLRRTRRDLRPWRIRETNPIRTLLRTANRIREEYVPDSGGSALDRVVLIAAFVLAALIVGHLLRRQSAFAALADARYASEGEQGVPTSAGIVAESVRIDGDVALDGRVRSRSASVIRNDGAQRETHLSFMLHPMMTVRRLAVDRGTSRMRRSWERLDLELDPPLAPREKRTLSFDLDGTPAEIDFELQAPGNFAVRWNRRRTAAEAIYMTDLSRSTVTPAATEVRMRLAGSDLAPVIRYSPWTLQQPQPPEQDERVTSEAVVPPALLEVHLRQPYPLAVDACGTITARPEIVSRCTTGLGSYVVFGGPLAQRAIAANATLAYLPAHEALAITQSHALASSIDLASEAWPGLDVPPHVIFIERPAETGDRTSFFDYQPWRLVEGIGSRGAVFLVPENAFTMTRSIGANTFAASIAGGVLRAKRRVAADQAGFFTVFYSSVAAARLGMRKSTAVERSGGFPPSTEPLLAGYGGQQSRMTKVLAALEYRVGADHFIEGINDFVSASGAPGTAKEMLAAIGRRAGVDLSRTYRDYFVGYALPKLTLSDVAFHRAGAKWEVTGAVTNTGTGEAFVPIALRTAQGSQWQTLRVDSGGSASFAFTMAGEPRSVQLDPDGVCYRHAVIGLVENVEYRGPS